MVFEEILENNYYNFILLSIRDNKSEQDISKIKELYKFLDKRQLFNICKENEVDSVVAANLMEIQVTDIPDYWLVPYQELNNRIRQYVKEVKNIGKHMKDRNIPLVVLKNGGICLSLMSDYGKCPMGDIDTLVKKEDFLVAHEVLLNLGYQLKFRSALEDERIEEAFNNGSAEYYKIIENGMDLWLELSWRSVAGRWIRPDQEPDTNDLINKAYEVDETGIFVLSPEDNLLQVALHTAKHSYVRAPGFRLHLDVDRIVSKTEIDWDVFIERVKRLKVCVPVYFSLFIPKLLFNTDVPNYVLEEISPGPLKKYIITKWLKKVGLMYPHEDKFTKMGYIFFTMLLYDSFGDLLKAIVPEKKWLKERYGIKSDIMIPYVFFKRIKDLIFRRNL